MKTTLTQSELLSAFLSERDVSVNSRATYRRELIQFFRWLSASKIDYRLVTESNIINYKNHLLATRSQTTADNYLTVVKLFFRWLHRKGYYHNVTSEIRRVSKYKGFRKKVLSGEQVRELLSIRDNTQKGLRDHAIITLMATAGLRAIEVVRANVEDIQDDMLYIQRKGRKEKDESVSLSDATIEAIQNYLLSRNNLSDDQPLFTSLSNYNPDQRLTPKTLSAVITSYYRRIGITDKRITAHSLRHTIAVHMLIKGYSIHDVQVLLGHASTSTTEIYVKYANDFVRKEKLKGAALDNVFNLSQNKTLRNKNAQCYEVNAESKTTTQKHHEKQILFDRYQPL